MGPLLNTAEWWQAGLPFLVLLVFQPVRLCLLGLALRIGGVPKDQVAKVLVKNADKDKLIDLLKAWRTKPEPPAIQPKPPGDDPAPERPRAVS